MTRTARFDHSNKKKALSASKWEDLKPDTNHPNAQNRFPKSNSNDSSKKKNRKKKYRSEFDDSNLKLDEVQLGDDRDKTDIASSLESAGRFILPRKRIKKKTLKGLDGADLSLPKPKGLQNLLKEVTEECGKLTSEQEKEVREVMKKDYRREDRRLKRIHEKESSQICFNCRQPGHDMKSCPKRKKTGETNVVICFKCGSTEHHINQCKVKLPPGEFPYATCFICGEKGHLSKQCEDNPKGLYPNGGCCNACGSKEHFKRNCPEHLKKQGIADFKLSTFTSSQNVESDGEELPKEDFKQQKRKKVVTF